MWQNNDTSSIYSYIIKCLSFYFRTQLDRHESNIDLLEHRLEKVIIIYII